MKHFSYKGTCGIYIMYAYQCSYEVYCYVGINTVGYGCYFLRGSNFCGFCWVSYP